MDFVWIYIKSGSYFAKCGMWNELEYSIKSVRKYYKGARCWVVGDDPELDVNFIPVEQIKEHPSKLPVEIDVTKKFRAIIESEISNEFILMYDDIYLLQPMTYNDLTITYGYNKVDDIETYIRKWSRSYKMLWKNTYRIIKELRDDIYDWETHLPRHLIKADLEQIIDIYSMDEIPLIGTSLYSAHFSDKTVLMDESTQFDLIQWTPGLDLDKGFQCKFMNIMDNAIVGEFKDKMKEVFGESVSVKSTYG